MSKSKGLNLQRLMFWRRTSRDVMVPRLQAQRLLAERLVSGRSIAAADDSTPTPLAPAAVSAGSGAADELAATELTLTRNPVRQIPTILVGCNPHESPQCDCLALDREEAGQLGTAHLIDRGHTELLVACGRESAFGRGCFRALKQIGYSGQLYPEHYPSIAGDSAAGLAWTIGYMRAMDEAVEA